jgi:hypothetical protein
MTTEPAEFDPIPHDFGVEPVFSGPKLSMYAAQKGGLWHFVWASVATDDGWNNFSIRQLHVPRYLVAEALERQLEFIRLAAAESGDPRAVHVSDLDWQEWGVGVTNNQQVFLTHSANGYAYPLGDLSTLIADDIALMQEARKAVRHGGDGYFLPDVFTPHGNAASTESKRLLEAIAFERLIHGSLDAQTRFELFSAYATLVDSPICREPTLNYVSDCIRDQRAIDFSDVPDDLGELFLTVQDELFNGARIWGPKVDGVDDDAVNEVLEAFKSLSDVQRCQFGLLRQLHNVVLLFGLARVTGAIDYEKYCELMSSGMAPDSEEEQAIRAQAAFIEFLDRV